MFSVYLFYIVIFQGQLCNVTLNYVSWRTCKLFELFSNPSVYVLYNKKGSFLSFQSLNDHETGGTICINWSGKIKRNKHSKTPQMEALFCLVFPHLFRSFRPSYTPPASYIYMYVIFAYNSKVFYDTYTCLL